MADEVFTNTDLSQLPVYSSTLTGDVYLNPSSKRQQEMRSAWDTALQLSTAGAVRWFLSQYRATSYEAAARLWLSKNSNRRWAYRTQVSPLMMERLWETAPSDGRPVLAISGGFQFIKNVTVRGGVIGSFDEGMDVGDLLAHSQLAMVAIQNLSVKDGPNFEADEKRKLGFNDIAYIIGAERNSSGTWLRIHDRGSDNLYFRLPDRVKVEKKEMGAKAKEIFVGASPDSTSIGARCRWTTISEALFSISRYPVEEKRDTCLDQTRKTVASLKKGQADRGFSFGAFGAGRKSGRYFHIACP